MPILRYSGEYHLTRGDELFYNSRQCSSKWVPITGGYIVHLHPKDMSNFKIVEYALPPVLLPEALEWEIDDRDFLLEWVKANDLPVRTYPSYITRNYTWSDGRRLWNMISVSECRESLANVQAAVRLWKGIETRDLKMLRKDILFDGTVCSITASYAVVRSINDMCISPEDEAYFSGMSFDRDEELTLYIAMKLLCLFVNEGLQDYMPRYEVRFLRREQDLPHLKFVEEMVCDSTMTAIWATIREVLSNSKIPKNRWPYLQCVDCKKWIDTSVPGVRCDRKRCDECAEKRKKELGKRRADRQRDRNKRANFDQEEAKAIWSSIPMYSDSLERE